MLISADRDGIITISTKEATVYLDPAEAGTAVRAISHYLETMQGLDALDALTDREKIALYRSELKHERDTGTTSILATQMRAAVGMT